MTEWSEFLKQPNTTPVQKQPINNTPTDSWGGFLQSQTPTQTVQKNISDDSWGNFIETQKVKEPINYTFGGFFKNVGKNVTDFTQGISILAGEIAKGSVGLLKHPLQNIKETYSKQGYEATKEMFVKPLVEELKKAVGFDEGKWSVGNIGKYSYEKPIDQLFNATILLGGVSSGLKGVGTLAKSEGALSAAATVGKIANAIDPFIILQKSGGKLWESKYLSPVKEMSEKYGWSGKGKEARIVKGDIQNLERALINESEKGIIDTLGKLKPDEYSDFLQYINGLKKAENLTPEMKKAVTFIDERLKVINPEVKQMFAEGITQKEVRAYAKQQGIINEVNPKLNVTQKFDIKNILAEQKMQARKWQTLAIKEGKITSAELKAGKVVTPQIIEEIKVKFPKSELLDEPLYFPMQQMEKPKLSDLFMDAKTFKAANMKKSSGILAQEWIRKLPFDDKIKKVANNLLPPDMAWAKYERQLIKYKKTEEYLETIKSRFAEPLINNSIKNLKEGYEIFAPDGFLKMYNAQNQIAREYFKVIASEGLGQQEALMKAVQNVQIPQNIVGLTKPKLYQIPREVSNQIRTIYKSREPIALVYQKSLDAWRMAVLSLRPAWIVNNAVGNLIFNTLGGVKPLSWVKATQKKYGEAVPDSVKHGFAADVSRPTYLGITADTKIGKAVQWIESTKPYQAVKKISDKMMIFNDKLEGIARSAHYIDKAEAIAMKNLQQRLGKKLFTADEIISEMKAIKGTEQAKKAIDSVNEFLNDYNGVPAIDKDFLRGVAPFWKFFWHSSRLISTLPFKYPGRAFVLNQLSKAGTEALEHDLKQYGITRENLPKYLQSAIPLFKKGDQVIFWNMASINPFGTLLGLGENPIGVTALSPIIKAPLEYISGTDFLKNKPFTSSRIIEAGGKKFELDPNATSIEDMREVNIVRPSAFEMVARQFPQYNLLKNVTAPYAQYGTGSLINPEPIMDTKTGKPKFPKSPALEVLKYLGISTTQVEDENLDQKANKLKESVFKSLMKRRALQNKR